MIASLTTLLLASIVYGSPLLEGRHSRHLTPVFTPKALAASTQEGCASTVLVTVTRFIDAASNTAVATPIASSAVELSTVSASSEAAVVTAAPPADDPAAANPTTSVPVSGAGGVLNPTSAADANKFDKTAVRAFTGVSLKSSAGKCLFIDPTAGDFRQNIIPIAVKDCTGSPGEKFDFVTSGVHNNVPGGTASLIVSSLMNGCISFDPRRAVNQAHVFSCGGRGGGEGETSDSQLFPFTAGEKTITIAPQNQQGKICLVDVGGQLTPADCNGDASQTFTIV